MGKYLVVPAVCLLALVALVLPAQAQNGRGRHQRIFVAPAPGAVTIDGNFDDWDRSGEIEIYVMKETSAMQGARFAMMYDAQALYLGGIVRDTSPMLNRHDPKVDPDMAWDSDCCQIYLNVNPALGFPVLQDTFTPVPRSGLLTMFLWHYTDRREACLSILEGFPWQGITYAPKGAVPADKFQGSYRLMDDKRGYTFEYRIPWTTLLAKAPLKAGDIAAGAVQFLWGSANGLKTAGGSGWAYDVMATPGFPFQNAGCWGKAIFAEHGNLSHAMVEDGAPPEPPLPLSFTYTLPKDGEVSIALVNGQGQQVRHILAQAPRKAGEIVERWDGLDDQGKPLPAGQYSWKGLYHDPITTKYLLAVHNSGHPSYATPDGAGAWGADHSNTTTVCAAGQHMLLAWGGGEAGWGLLRTDLQGRRQWGAKYGADFLACDGERIYAGSAPSNWTKTGVVCYALQDSGPLNFGCGTPEIEVPAGGTPETNGVYGLAYGSGALYVSYMKRNLVAKYDARQGTVTETYTVPAPGGLTVCADGSLAVLSNGVILRVNDGKVAPLIADHLDMPVSITADAKGSIYVANRGKLQNVSLFTPAGKYLRSIGKKGGRPLLGKWDKQGMLEAGGIAIDAQGRLWVAETLDGPRRHSVWNVKNGTLITEFFGGSEYSTHVSMDPKHADEVFCHNVIWSVNLEKGAWYPKSTIWRSSDPNSPREIRGGDQSYFNAFTARNGKQYGWGLWPGVGPVLFMRRGDHFVPIMAGIFVCDYSPYVPYPPYPIFADKKQYPIGYYAWQDKNDDQIMQADEIQHNEAAFCWVDDALNLYSNKGYLLRPLHFEKNGQPVYDTGTPEKHAFLTGNAGHDPLFTDSRDGSTYTLTNEYGIAHWAADGSMLWNYKHQFMSWHDSLNLAIAKPGEVFGLTKPMGAAGDFAAFSTYFGPIHLFSKDGLYVAKVFKDGRLGDWGPEVLNCEAYAGQFVQVEKDKRYLLLVGDTDGRVSQVNGLETVRHLPGGACVISEDDVKKVQEAQAEYSRRQGIATPLTIAGGGRKALDLAPAITRLIDEKRSFSVRMAHDAENLYATYTVESPHELTNSFPDPQTIFKGGNCLDLQLATDLQADPKRTTPAPGDLRLLITRQAGKTVAVLYRPKIAGFSGQPVTFKTYTGQESFDVITVSDRVTLDYRKTSTGFTAMAAIPLELLGWSPKSGTLVKLDVGVLFGNETGNLIARRAYWANNSFTANVTNDIPHESRLEPAQWGMATVE